jgi:hypothetical protein
MSLTHEPRQLYNPDTLAQTQNVFLMQYPIVIDLSAVFIVNDTVRRHNKSITRGQSDPHGILP